MLIRGILLLGKRQVSSVEARICTFVHEYPFTVTVVPATNPEPERVTRTVPSSLVLVDAPVMVGTSPVEFGWMPIPQCTNSHSKESAGTSFTALRIYMILFNPLHFGTSILGNELKFKNLFMERALSQSVRWYKVRGKNISK